MNNLSLISSGDAEGDLRELRKDVEKLSEDLRDPRSCMDAEREAIKRDVIPLTDISCRLKTAIATTNAVRDRAERNGGGL
ncbi:hypothetical protein MKZ38_001404 [Zalerion maritima]|uniref:Uncharacterized protein n=1 Tax=Zalerion maritima TaxID=339359 RepID=A0AAD5RQE2_9PEZI|nr:hypothetical protein MKZ38_001404 [Zalerion maritima]